MKRVRGDRLDRWIADGRNLGEQLGVFLRVCETLAFVHSHGVIHRHVNPQNIMVGQFGEVLVLGFGVALMCGIRVVAHCGFGRAPFHRRHARLHGARAGARQPGRGSPGGCVRAGRCSSRLMASAAPQAAIARKAVRRSRGALHQDVPALAGRRQPLRHARCRGAPRAPGRYRLKRVGRRYRVPIVLVLTYLVVRVLLLWLFHV